MSTPTANDPLAVIPDHPLPETGFVSRAFREQGCHTLRDAFAAVWRLPYRRNADPADPLAPLRESRGTCSTKHALLARLAREAGVDMQLRLAVYLMSEANTPGVGPVLARHGLDAIPESHCYLICEGQVVDLTHFDSTPEEPIRPFLFECTIDVGQVGAGKRDAHQAFLQRWAQSPEAQGLSGDALWAIREECIAALSA